MQAQDITERKRAVEALRLSEEKHRAILEGIDEGYYEVDLAGHAHLLQRRALPLARLRAARSCRARSGRRLTDAEDGAASSTTCFRQVFATGRLLKNAEFEVVGKDGTRRAVAGLGRPHARRAAASPRASAAWSST